MKLFIRFWNHLRHHPLTLAWLVLPVGLGIGAFVFEDWRGRQALADEVAKWRAAGLALTWEDVSAEQKIPAPEDDFFNAPIIAEWLAAAPDKDREKTRLAQISPRWWLTWGRRGEPKRVTGSSVGIIPPVPYDEFDKMVRSDEDQAKHILTLLTSRGMDLDELAEAAKRPARRLGKVNVEEPLSEWSMEDYGLCRTLLSAARVLQWRTRANFHLERTDEAFADVMTLLRLVRLQDHPGELTVARMVSDILIKIALELVWEGLKRESWNEAQLAEMAEALAPLHPAGSFLEACRMDEAFNAWQWTDPKSRINGIYRKFFIGEHHERSVFWSRVLDGVAPEGAGHQIVRARFQLAAEELYMPGGVRSTELQVGHLDRFEARRTSRAGSLYEKWAWGRWDWVNGLGTAALLTQQRLDLARIAVALERWRLAKGSYPAALADLTPQYLASIPEDRFVPGRAVSYRVLPAGHYELYACGDDRVDDGGVPSPGQAKKGDIVWKLVP